MTPWCDLPVVSWATLEEPERSDYISRAGERTEANCLPTKSGRLQKTKCVLTGELQLLPVSLYMVHGTCDSSSPFFQRSSRLLGGSCQLVSGQQLGVTSQ